jgi:hypothetical protein
MANRFGGEYRKPHSGASAVAGQQHPRLTPELRLQSWSGEDEKGEFTQTGANKKYTLEKPNSEPEGDYYAREPKGADSNSFRDNPPKDEGGSSILRNSKKPPKSPSGGMALSLPIPEKVK